MLSILISAAALAACYRSTVDPAECSNEPTADYPSSDGQWKSVAFLRQCGAGPIELQVSVLPVNASLPNEPGNALRQDASQERVEGHHSFAVRQKWKNPRELWISHERGMKVKYAAWAVGAITVIHTDGEIAND